MIAVIDASVLISVLFDTGKEGEWAESVIADHQQLYAPELLLIECMNVLRREERNRVITAFEAGRAYRELTQLKVQLMPIEPFTDRIWELRKNITIYDAAYVSLAETLNAPLATLDRKLARTKTACNFLTP